MLKKRVRKRKMVKKKMEREKRVKREEDGAKGKGEGKYG